MRSANYLRVEDAPHDDLADEKHVGTRESHK